MANKPLLSGVEKFLLIGLIVFFGYSFFKKGNFKMVERTEEVTITDGRSSSKSYEKLKTKSPAIQRKSPPAQELDTDDVLGKLARTFSKGKTETKRQMKEMGLSEDEVDYYQEVQKETSLTEQVQSAKDWFNILRASASTYGTVKSMLNDITDGQSEEENIDLKNTSEADEFYKNLEATFNISEIEARAFAELGKRKVSDWAKFIEEKSKE